ncbi:MAG TPA: hypothetical protein V6C58_17470 [Allocoleopsis sp.]
MDKKFLDSVLNEVLDMREEILKSQEKKSISYYKSKYSILAKGSYSLFSMVYRNEIDYLPKLYNYYVKLYSIKDDLSNKRDIELDLSQEMFDEYVKPILEKK